ncbi:MAG: RidA family protein, partial [Bryobacteraceae bacterium]
DNVVYTQVYLSDMKRYEAMNKVYGEFFPRNPPARAVIGVTRMPTDTPVEINAIAVRNHKLRKALKLPPAMVNGAPLSYGALVGNRYYLSGIVGRHEDGTVPQDARAQVKLMVERAQAVLKVAGLELRHLASANIYVDGKMPFDALVKVLEEFIPSETATTVIQTAALPLGSHIEITGVASRDTKRQGKCNSVGDTLYCSGRTGTIDQVAKELKGDLEAAGAGLGNVVASNVYIDHLDNFNAMNKVYATYFKGSHPTRTTVQTANNPPTLALTPSTGAKAPVEGPRVQISVTAVR